MYTHLPHDELDLFVTKTGFYITPTLEQERLPRETFENNALFKANLEEASNLLYDNLSPRSEDFEVTSKEDTTARKIKVGQQSIQLKPTISSPALSQHPPKHLEGDSETNDFKVCFSSSYSDSRSSTNIPSKTKRTYLQILYDRSQPPCEIVDFTLDEPYRKCRIFGIAGFVQLLTGWHLIVIRAIRQVGTVKGNAIFQISSILLLPFDYASSIAALDESSTEIPEETLQYCNQELSSSSASLFDRLKAVVLNSPKEPKSPLTLGEQENDDNGHDDLEEKAPASEVNSFGSENKATVEETSEILNKESITSDNEPNDSLKQYAVPDPKKSNSQDEVLEARMKREIDRLFGQGGNMYVSYSYDISSSLQRQESLAPGPFWKSVSAPFWWNRPLQSELVTAELHNWILPLVQGFVQTEECELDGFPFNVTLISRRDTRRLGMRYQRRGINKDGNVANFAESEQLLEMTRGTKEAHVCSFLQIRGSIPLFWSQSPYSLKPVPVLERGEKDNRDAFVKHFSSLHSEYGSAINLVSLTERQGREHIVGSAYESHLASSQEDNPEIFKGVQFIDFDFHKETQGIGNFNLAPLVDKLEPGFNEIGYYWRVSDSESPFTTQKGVFRVNCMDCLDRTNVVQSSLARHVLNLQLFRLGLQEHPDEGLAHHAALELTINALWANNGDALSRAYAGTGALKADMTRTGKRNLQGIVNDATNSITRFYFNAFRDFFTQAVLDYLQGHHRLDKFREISETQVAPEPGHENRLGRIRQLAVQTSATLVLQEGETLIGGWVVLSPVPICRLFHSNLEEKVVLLTSDNLYICSFHFGLEKVLGYTCVSLEQILQVQNGEYFLTLNDLRNNARLSKDELQVGKNDGLVIHYVCDVNKDRQNTLKFKSLTNAPRLIQFITGNKAASTSNLPNPSQNESKPTSPKFASRFIAFKGLANLESKDTDNSIDDTEDKLDSELIETQSNKTSFDSSKVFNSKEKLSNETSIDTQTLIAFDTVQQIFNLIQQTYETRIRTLSKTEEDRPYPKSIPTLVDTIQSPEALQKLLYPTAAGFLSAPKKLGNRLLKTFG